MLKASTPPEPAKQTGVVPPVIVEDAGTALHACASSLFFGNKKQTIIIGKYNFLIA
jgi:hypothetical protein